MTPTLTPTLARCHLKTTNKSAKFETLRSFLLLFFCGFFGFCFLFLFFVVVVVVVVVFVFCFLFCTGM